MTGRPDQAALFFLQMKSEIDSILRRKCGYVTSGLQTNTTTLKLSVLLNILFSSLRGQNCIFESAGKQNKSVSL